MSEHVQKRSLYSAKTYRRYAKKRSKGRTFSSVIIFLIGLSIFLYPHVAQYINNLSATRIVEEYTASVMASENGTAVAGDDEGVNALGYNEEDVYGTIFIPKLSLELPIYVGDTDANLSRGIAHMEGTSLPVGGNSTHSVLAGHNGMVTNEWFTNIDKLTEGDLFYVRNGTTVLTYSVVAIAMIDPTDTSSLYIKEGRDLVTLLTCDDTGAKRLIVTGERVVE